MTKAILIWTSVFIFNLAVVTAQTGLFDSGTVGTFATTGVTIVVLILVIRELFKQFFSKKK